MIDLREFRRLAGQVRGSWKAVGCWLYHNGEEYGRVRDPHVAYLIAQLLNHAVELSNSLAGLVRVNQDLRKENLHLRTTHPAYKRRKGRARN